MGKHIFFFLLMLTSSLGTFAQVDPHFSEYYQYPLWLNPASTGVIDGEYRVSAIYRNQWASISTPYSTAAISADMNTDKDINIGLNILRQTAGDGGYKYTNGYLSIAYTGIRFGEDGNQHFSIGLQGGFLNRGFDPTKLKFGDQWVQGLGYDSQLITADIFNNNRSSTFDAAAGLLYYDATPDKKIKMYGGVSFGHLTKPEDPFLLSEKKKLPIRSTIHAGVSIQLNENFSLIPNLLYLRQGNASEFMIGTYAQMKVNDNTDLMAGINYRANDAISPYAGIYFNGMTVGFAYDATISSLGKAAGGTNGFEISITFFGKRSEKNNYLKCPRM